MVVIITELKHNTQISPKVMIFRDIMTNSYKLSELILFSGTYCL